MYKKLIFLVFIFLYGKASAQVISGRIMEADNTTGIPWATVYEVSGKYNSTSDSAGNFKLKVDSLPARIVVMMTGYKNDTIEVDKTSSVNIHLKKSVELSEVNISARKQGIAMSTINPINSEKVTEKELLRAACCNLSEAFETNPSVNVAYKDAVTGVKEIQLLGLGGTYVQMLSENVPDMRGLAGIYGLTFVPGPWIESIQLTKGSGSVINGYESTTGQINLEYKKPDNKEQPRFYLNLFSDDNLSLEANAIYKHVFSKHWSTILMLHGKRMDREVDGNKDGFMDTPDNKAINFYNRWQYHSGTKIESQLSVKFLSDKLAGGQTKEVMSAMPYKTNVTTTRAQFTGKLGLIFPEKPLKSIGNIFNITYHDMESSFGLKKYDATEKSLYVQSIYQNILWKANHRIRTGLTFRYNLLEQDFPGIDDRIEEYIPGAFLEYTYEYLEKLTLVFGLREDLQMNDNFEFTPRFHGKYNFSDDFIIRASAGKSYRTPYLIADHLYVLASSRQIAFNETIRPERAWNYGLNFTKRFDLHNHETTLSADVYRTSFIDQLVVDTYSDSSAIQYYNLKGKSFSNSVQATINFEVFENLNFRVAYKIDDVKSTFNGKLEEQPLVSRERALGTIAYNTLNEHWKFDYTFVWEGKKKLQNVYYDENHSRQNYSPTFSLMNIQVTKVFRKFEVYGGAENVLDYRQPDPIINPENPFGNSFDATNIWGPIQGRRMYVGLRYSIK